MTLLGFAEVQSILDTVKEGQSITVTFSKVNGELVTYTGTLDVGANRSQSVALYSEEGWKRFNVNKVWAISVID